MEEQFEKWFKEVSFGMDDGYKPGLKVILFTAWSASRTAIEIDLPVGLTTKQALDAGYMCDYAAGMDRGIDECADAIRAAGLRVKEK